jgi:hypothetical protein
MGLRMVLAIQLKISGDIVLFTYFLHFNSDYNDLMDKISSF